MMHTLESCTGKLAPVFEVCIMQSWADFFLVAVSGTGQKSVTFSAGIRTKGPIFEKS